MKILINKVNPQIRITAPEIRKVQDSPLFEPYYTIKEGDSVEVCLSEHYWTLIEEEENISWADRLKERLSKMSQEEIDKAFEEMGGDNDESPTLEEYLKAAYHSPIETEPVDLEKEADFEDEWKTYYDSHLYNRCPMPSKREIARHFYELGKKGGKI